MIVRASVRSKANPNEHREVEEIAENYEAAHEAILVRVPDAWQILHLITEDG